jgi:hypothetical protein
MNFNVCSDLGIDMGVTGLVWVCVAQNWDHCGAAVNKWLEILAPSNSENLLAPQEGTFSGVLARYFVCLFLGWYQ